MTQLIDCLKSHGLLVTGQVSKFHNTPCDNCDIEIVDFNEVATLFYQRHGGQKPATVNGLIVNSDGEPFFVEMNQYYVDIGGFHNRFLENDLADNIINKIIGTNRVLNDMKDNLVCV